MNPEKVLELVKAGFTKDEIMNMFGAGSSEAKEPEKKEPKMKEPEKKEPEKKEPERKSTDDNSADFFKKIEDHMTKMQESMRNEFSESLKAIQIAACKAAEQPAEQSLEDMLIATFINPGSNK